MATVSFYEVKEVIGEEVAQKIMDEFPCMHLYIPNNMPKFPDNLTRNKYIKNSYHTGATIPEIADMINLSVETVRKIVNER
ncbi:Mor transcription activator family protein [Tepidibacter hydrothermalis]|uniref:Mor transcription activator family protein n=1 Tax=Tepidibacter hydrothermalis TaxID=3036126 RepID=A0ABY8EGH2_9FIRM|nr:Mor transcription activator family protein [Tepidibacter hydrothermalis]WFD09960.1 Mor transcription activator family protein [Tepidibacter hydrothermalis]